MDFFGQLFKGGTVKQWLLLSAIGGMSMFFFILFAGEDDIHNPMPIERFVLLKIISLIGLYACYRFGKYCNQKGWFPRWNDEEDEL